MYLVSWSEEQHILEASLGGRVTIEEMAVFTEEIREVIDMVNEQPFLLVLDYSRSRSFDHQTDGLLADLKDFCLEHGAEKVVSVVRDAEEVAPLVTANIQKVLEGKEQFVVDPTVIEWTPPAAGYSYLRIAA
jgi:hypothetical protein